MSETPSLYASGTSGQSVTSTITYLSSINVAGLFSFHIDCNALAAGDVLEIYLYRIILHSGTGRIEALLDRLVGAQPAFGLIKSYSGIGNDLTDSNSIQFGIAQTLGSARALPWKVLQY